jgi:hypothetical protein
MDAAACSTISYDARRIRKFPEEPLLVSTNTGSFDCVVVRFAERQLRSG